MESKHPDEELSAFLSGELNQTESEIVRLHLKDCPICAEKLKELELLTKVLADNPGIEPSSGFVEGVLKRVDEERRIVAFRSRRTIIWLATAAAIVFVVFLLSIQKEMKPGAPVSRAPVVKAPASANSNNPGTPASSDLNLQDAELIANLDLLENIDLIENYDNLQYLEAALLAEGEEKGE